VRVIRYESGHGVPMAAFNANAARVIADVLKEPRPKPPKNMVD